MLKKLLVLLTITSLFFSPSFAQRRNYRLERQELARKEKEEKRKEKEDFRTERPSLNYKTNILSVSPFTAMDIGVGFGLSYEKLLGEEKMIGIIVPLYLILDNEEFTPNPNQSNPFNSYFYFNPGVKIYPFGQRKVTYSVGPSLLLGYGGGQQQSYRIDSNSYYAQDFKSLRVGMLVNNYIQFHITPSFILGLEAGLGVLYLDRKTVTDNVSSVKYRYYNGINVSGQFSMTLGFRF